MDEAFINGAVLEWARKRRDKTHEELAARVGAKVEQVRAWEREDYYPPFGKAENLAKILKIPFGYFFLPGPLPDDAPLPDLRTIAAEERGKLHPNSLDIINVVQRKQDWYREYATFFAHGSLPFVGRFTTATPTKTVAKEMSSALTLDELRAQADDWQNFLSLLIHRAEALGVIVIRTGIVKSDNTRPLRVKDFRGFAISDKVAPLVFINGKDSISAKTFTLVHELTHIWVNSTGISNATGADDQETPPVERFCNAVAAEALVPKAEFVSLWRELSGAANRIDKIARRFFVSGEVIVRRSFDVGIVAWDEYQGLLRDARARQKPPKKAKGGNPDLNMDARNSSVIVRAVVRAIRHGRLHHRDAAKLLGVKAGSVSRLMGEKQSTAV